MVHHHHIVGDTSELVIWSHDLIGKVPTHTVPLSNHKTNDESIVQVLIYLYLLCLHISTTEQLDVHGLNMIDAMVRIVYGYSIT